MVVVAVECCGSAAAAPNSPSKIEPRLSCEFKTGHYERGEGGGSNTIPFDKRGCLKDNRVQRKEVFAFRTDLMPISLCFHTAGIIVMETVDKLTVQMLHERS